MEINIKSYKRMVGLNNKDMKESEILEGNKLIADFMGGIYSENALAWGFGDARIEHKELVVRGKLYKNLVWAEKFEKDLKYHSSWDWLMPVVEKIENLNFCVTIGTSNRKDKSQRTYCEIGTPEMWNFELTLEDSPVPIIEIDEKNSNTKIINVWLAVVEFIKWWNEQKK